MPIGEVGNGTIISHFAYIPWNAGFCTLPVIDALISGFARRPKEMIFQNINLGSTVSLVNVPIYTDYWIFNVTY